MKYLIIVLLGAAPLATICALDAIHLVESLAGAEPTDANAPQSVVKEASETAVAADLYVGVRRPALETFAQVTAAPYGAAGLTESMTLPDDLSGVAEKWQPMQQALSLCDSAALVLAVEPAAWSGTHDPKADLEELQQQIDDHIDHRAVIRSRQEELDGLATRIEQAQSGGIEGGEDLLRLTRARHDKAQRDLATFDEAIAALGFAQRQTVDLKVNDQANEKTLAEAQSLLEQGQFEAAQKALAPFRRPSSPTMLVQLDDLSAKIQSAWFAELEDQVQAALQEDQFGEAEALIDDYRGPKAEQTARLTRRVASARAAKIQLDNSLYWEHGRDAMHAGKYEECLNWLLKSQDPKPAKWSEAAKMSLDWVADALVKRAKKISGLTVTDEWKKLRSDMTRFVEKMNRMNVDPLPDSCRECRRELDTLLARFEFAELRRNWRTFEPVEWAKQAVALSADFPDRDVKRLLREDLELMLKTYLHVPDEDNDTAGYRAAGKKLVEAMDDREVWEQFAEVVERQTGDKFDQAKETVKSILDDENWPSMEKILSEA